MARLLVLWLLSEQPMYGYQIKKAISDEGMRFWFDLKDASIYSVLRTLTKNGHTIELATEQPGKRPPRTRYAITSKGRRYYESLIIEALAVPSLPVTLIDVALSARGDLDTAVVSETLATRAKALHELVTSIERVRLAAPSQAIVDRNLAIVRAELQWLEKLDHTTIT